MSAVSVGTHSRPTRPRVAAARKALTAARKRAAGAAAATQARMWSLRQAVLGVAGCAFVDGSAYQVNLGMGLLTTGVSLWLLGWLSEDEDED